MLDLRPIPKTPPPLSLAETRLTQNFRRVTLDRCVHLPVLSCHFLTAVSVYLVLSYFTSLFLAKIYGHIQ